MRLALGALWNVCIDNEELQGLLGNMNLCDQLVKVCIYIYIECIYIYYVYISFIPIKLYP